MGVKMTIKMKVHMRVKVKVMVKVKLGGRDRGGVCTITRLPARERRSGAFCGRGAPGDSGRALGENRGEHLGSKVSGPEEPAWAGPSAGRAGNTTLLVH